MIELRAVEAGRLTFKSRSDICGAQKKQSSRYSPCTDAYNPCLYLEAEPGRVDRLSTRLEEGPPVVPNPESKSRVACLTPDLQLVSTIETIMPQGQPFSPPMLENPLLSLKKVKSYFYLPSARSRSRSPFRPAAASPEKDANALNGGLLKESPSKRDLKKQKKFMSKISFLGVCLLTRSLIEAHEATITVAIPQFVRTCPLIHGGSQVTLRRPRLRKACRQLWQSTDTTQN